MSKRKKNNETGQKAQEEQGLLQRIINFIIRYMLCIFPWQNIKDLQPPLVIKVIITALQLILFCVDQFTQDNREKHQVWRYLTYMLVHISYGHLVWNLLIQVVIVIQLKMVHKWRVIVVYLAGGLTGTLLHALAYPTANLAGASCVVCALFTAYMGNIILHWNNTKHPYVYLILSTCLMYTGMQVSYSLYIEFYWENGSFTHVGGYLSWFLMGIWVLENFKDNRQYMRWTSLILYILLMIVLIALNIFRTD